MNNAQSILSNLEERFTEPKGWRWHSFTRTDGRRLRFGALVPTETPPDATIVCLPGLSEFGEKYFEIARWAKKKNLAFWVLDWAGQGMASRYLSNPHKRHAYDFQDDVDDLHYFIMEYVKYASVSTDVGRIPMAMLGHSMGGNIGMRYLAQHPEIFECATFSAPMLGIKGLDPAFKLPLLALSKMLKIVAGKSYVHGGEDWHEDYGLKPEELSSDPVRNQIIKQWFAACPDLQAGSVTYGWVDAALRSCAHIQSQKFLSTIQTHCSFVKAGQAKLVSNKAIDYIVSHLERKTLVDLPDSEHEVMMERDEIRDVFLDTFYQSIKENIIERPGTLKPF